MHTRKQTFVFAVCAALWLAASAHAAPPRVLVVSGRGVSADTLEAIDAAVAKRGEAVDNSEYLRLARANGETPTSAAALKSVAPRANAQLIIVATKAGAKVALEYRDGSSGEVLHKDTVPAGRRGKAKISASVGKMLAGLGPQRAEPPVAAVPIAQPDPEPQYTEQTPADEPETEAAESEPEAVPDPEETSAEPSHFVFEVSAGLGGAMRQLTLPTRAGIQSLDTGLFPGFSLGLHVATPLSSRWWLRAAVDYRSSLGLQGVDMQRATEMSTPLRAHAVGFGVAPGYRFSDAQDSIGLYLHLGWYFRGLRPIAQLALPEVSWHAAVVRPELHVPLADGAVTLRLAPELLVVAGLYTTLPDASGIARSGLGFGGEASIDFRLAAALGLRVEYRESHARLSTAWAESLSDVERFAAVRVLLWF
jgi:hypothetical protein